MRVSLAVTAFSSAYPDPASAGAVDRNSSTGPTDGFTRYLSAAYTHHTGTQVVYIHQVTSLTVGTDKSLNAEVISV
jgi:hypothetical protein